MDADLFFGDTPQIIIIQQQQNEEDMSDLPLLEAAGSSHHASGDTPDVDMQAYGNDYDDYDDVPALRSVSGSDSDSDRDADEVEMQAVNDDAIWTEDITNPPLIEIEPIRYPPPRSANRRARVEDDEDEERDRRHPSQRVNSPINIPDSTSSSNVHPRLQSQPPAAVPAADNNQHFPLNLNFLPLDSTFNLGTTPTAAGANPNAGQAFRGFAPQNVPGQPTGTGVAGAPPATADGNAPRNPFPQFFAGGISISIDIDNRPFNPDAGDGNGQSSPNVQIHTFPPLPLDQANPLATHLTQQFQQAQQAQPTAGQPQPATGQPNQPHGPTLGDLFGSIGVLGDLLGIEPDVDDPDRATKLITGLEEVPVGLVRRLERIGDMKGGAGETSGHHPTNEDLSGGDSGCAICWEKLLIEERDGGGFGVETAGVEVKVEKSTTSAASGDQNASSSTSSEPQSSTSGTVTDMKYPKIVTLPCAHVFHASCLVPWFSRPKQTTCPTCRFNIDPDNLTYVPYRQRQRTREANTDPNPGVDGNTNPNAHPTQNVDDANNNPVNGDLNQQQTISAFFNHLLGRDDDDPDAVERIIPIQMVPPNTLNTAGSPAGQRQPASGPFAAASAPPPLTPTRRAGSEPPANRTPISGLGIGQPLLPRARLGDHTVHSIPIAGGGTLLGPFFVPMQALAAGFNGQQQAQGGTPAPATQGAQPQPQTPGLPIIFSPVPPYIQVAHSGGANIPVTAGIGEGAGEANPQPQVPRLQPHGAGRQEDTSGQPHPPFDHEVIDVQVSEFDFNPITGAFTMRDGPAMQRQQQPQPQPQAPQPQADGTVGNPPPTDAGQTHGFSFPPFPAVAGLNFGGNRQFVGGDVGRQVTEALQRAFGGQPPADGITVVQAFQPHQQPQQQQQQHGPYPPQINMALHTGAAPGPNATPVPPPPNPLFNVNANAANPNPAEIEADGFVTLQQMAPWLRNPETMARMLLATGLMAAARGPIPPSAHLTEKREWTPPPAPGPTLRQRIEKREREAGLRCFDVSCGIGPSDEDPYVDDVDGLGQLFIRSTKLDDFEGNGKQKEKETRNQGNVCGHTFHSSCLVSAERVALRGAEKVVIGDDVEVSCPVCRGVGCVSKEEWDEGVSGLI